MATPQEIESEVRAVLGTARALLRELCEEGVETFARDASSDTASTADAHAVQMEHAHDLTADAKRATQHSPTKESVDPRAADSAVTRRSNIRDVSPDSATDAPTNSMPSTAVHATSPPQTPARATRPPTPHWDESVTLEAVRSALGDCQRCELASGRTQIVFGEGNPNAEILFLGEGPGEQEDLHGIPFCGRAGELLTSMIEKGMQIPRSSVYICNAVKCRPPQSRTPLEEEVAACFPFLDGQIRAIKPKVIVALGKPAASLLLGRSVAIARERGHWAEYRGIPVMPTFHPAYLLRQYTPENRRLVWEDLQAVLEKAKSQGESDTEKK